MATPENGLKISNGIDNQPKPRRNGRLTVKIYPDGTACENQLVDVEAGTPCRWTGFDKLTNEFFGRPENENES